MGLGQFNNNEVNSKARGVHPRDQRAGKLKSKNMIMENLLVQ